jgi:hypothetical protein
MGRISLALGSVVTICSCSISEAAILANIALRWLAVRFSLRPDFPWRMSLLLVQLRIGRLSAAAGDQ